MRILNYNILKLPRILNFNIFKLKNKNIIISILFYLYLIQFAIVTLILKELQQHI